MSFTPPIYSGPIKEFTRIDANQLVEAMNALIRDINVRLVGAGAISPSGAIVVSIRQLKLALAAAGVMQTVYSAVPALASDPVNIEWMSGNFSVTGDTLWSFVKTTLAYNNAQMDVLYSAAAGYPA